MEKNKGRIAKIVERETQETALCDKLKSMESSYASFRKNYQEFLSFARKMEQTREPGRKKILIYFACESYNKLKDISDSMEEFDFHMYAAMQEAQRDYPIINQHLIKNARGIK